MTILEEVKHELIMAIMHLERRKANCESWLTDNWRTDKEKKQLKRHIRVTQKAIEKIKVVTHNE